MTLQGSNDFGSTTVIDRLHRLLLWWWCHVRVEGRVMRAAAIVAGITLVAKVTSFGRELIVAASFGTGDALDAFLIALAVPSFAVNIIGASFNSALIPTYIKVRDRQGFDEARRLLGNISCVSIGLLLFVVAALSLGGTYLLAGLAAGFSTQKLALANRLFFILLPIVALSGLSTTWGAVSTAHARFAPAPMAQVVACTCPVLFLLCLGARIGIYALAWGTLAGSVLEAAVLRFGVRRLGHRQVFRWAGFEPHTRMVLREYAPMVLAALASSSAPLVDQAMASRLGGGSVATLGYGAKPVVLVYGIGALAVGSAILPHFSEMSAARDWRGLRQALITYSGLLTAATLPIVAGSVLASRPIIRMLYARGAFGAHDVDIVASVFAAYSFQIPAYLLSILGVRLLSALNENRTILYIALFNVVVNFVGDYVLMQIWGAAGIALGTSIVYAISTCFVFARVFALLRHRTHADTAASAL